MTLARATTRGAVGMDAPKVSVEAHVSGGLPGFNVVGLPETVVRESRERVRSALKTCGFRFPDGRITVNLAPAELPKGGGRFDLPIALALLAASGQLDAASLRGLEFMGELSLAGDLRPIRGVLLAARAARAPLVIPAANGAEAALVEDADVRVADHLLDIVAHLQHGAVLARPEPAVEPPLQQQAPLEAIHGQHAAKRALIVAAAGGHNMLMQGPPGTGKTLLARALVQLLPPLDRDEALEVAAIHSLGGQLQAASLRERPFRSPHHTTSAAALIGGGSLPQPGEISLAHRGVLFLDEIAEFQRPALESLREPLEGGEIIIARARRRVRFPARFQLVAAMNPCPAGRHCGGRVECLCSAERLRRYRARLSGPLLDRIDLHVDVPALPLALLSRAIDADGARQPSAAIEPDAGTVAGTDESTSDSKGAEAPDAETLDSHTARASIVRARACAETRQQCLNAHLSAARTEACCRPDAAARALLEQAGETLKLSARGWHRTLRVARTIADLAEQTEIDTAAMAEALSYRPRLEAPI